MGYSGLEKVLRTILHPIVRLCIRQSCSAQQFIEIVKQVYVDVASDLIERTEKELSVSRVSVATGLNRRDVTRIMKGGEDRNPNPGIITRVVGRWQEDERFRSEHGIPKELEFGGEGDGFQELVKSTSSDVSPTVVLEELERIGAVEKKGEKIQLSQNVDRAKAIADESYRILAEDVSSIIEAFHENLDSSSGVSHLYSRSEFSNIFLEDIAEVNRWLQEEGAHFHKKTREHLARFDKNLSPGSAKVGGGKVSIVAFSFSTKV